MLEQLTEREKTMFIFFANELKGNKLKDTISLAAKNYNITEHTVQSHLKNIREKTGLYSCHQIPSYAKYTKNMVYEKV